MIDKRYLNWKNKIGYGAGDVAGNVVYAFLSTFMMFYLTDTVGMNVGIVGILMAVSRLLDALTDLLFGNLLDRTSTRMGKARPWMLLGYIGCAVMLAAIFMIPSHWGDAAKYAYFFITYTLLNAVFYTVNNIAYATLTALITKNTSERVQLGSIRYMFAFAATMIIQTATMDLVFSLGGGAAGWKVAAIIYAVIGLIVNTISCLCVKELPVKDLYTTDLMEYPQPEKPCSMAEGFHLLFSNKFYLMICGIYLMSQLCQSSLNMGVYYMKYLYHSHSREKASGNVQAESGWLRSCICGAAWHDDLCILRKYSHDACFYCHQRHWYQPHARKFKRFDRFLL